MKRWLIWSLHSVATFCIGTASAQFFILDSPPDSLIEEIPQQEVMVSQIPQPTVELELIEDINGWAGPDYPFKIKLLNTGEGFHGNEVDAKTGEIWLGLFEEGGSFRLREVPLKISRVYDDVVDDPNTKLKTGKTVSVTHAGKPILLLKNANLPKRLVPTFFLGKTWDDTFEPQYENTPPEEILTTLKENFTQSYESSIGKFELKVIRARNQKGQEILALVLRSGHARQVLHTMQVTANVDLGTLYWVGDLDQDGKPDFYLDLFEHYNVGNRVLYLSSHAKPGNLVKKVAYFWTTGC